MVGGFGGDRIFAGEGDDFVDGGAAGDRINAGPGNDTVHGGTGTDHIRGGAGDDVLHATSSGDHIFGGTGNDTVYVNNGTAVDTVDCGPGADVLHINPLAMRGGFSNNRSRRRGKFKHCESIVETPPIVDPAKGRKKLIRNRGGTARGTERNDNLLGSSGPDRIFGYGGNDIIWANRKPTGASRGTDRIDAGAGDDIVYGASRGGKTVTYGGAGQRLPPGRRRRQHQLHHRRPRRRHGPAGRARLQPGERRRRQRHRVRVLEGPHEDRLRPGRRHGQDRQEPARHDAPLRARHPPLSRLRSG